ncbi:MAG TPA: DUF6285 domain-containing protein [Casimicrobiaceae bacterium]|nr:DUF6285 domain-containing protein [Casimicrobiaceae bacterium]
MKVEPAGEELLRVARASLLETLLPLLPAESHYTARMVANAMAIAAREMQQPPAAIGVDAARLAREIREGRHDAGDIATLLREITRERLAVSNPRLLAPVDKR